MTAYAVFLAPIAAAAALLFALLEAVKIKTQTLGQKLCRRSPQLSGLEPKPI